MLNHVLNLCFGFLSSTFCVNQLTSSKFQSWPPRSADYISSAVSCTILRSEQQPLVWPRFWAKPIFDLPKFQYFFFHGMYDVYMYKYTYIYIYIHINIEIWYMMIYDIIYNDNLIYLYTYIHTYIHTYRIYIYIYNIIRVCVCICI